MKLKQITFSLDNMKQIQTCKPLNLVMNLEKLANLKKLGFDIRLISTQNI
jgi:hypothetical protein